jgi:hypothetical protein
LKLRHFYIFILTVCTLSCNKSTPAGFWKGFDKDDLKINNSDQGPWGGYRAMYWKRSQGKFSENEIIKYATDNGWKLADSKTLKSSTVNGWLSNNTPVFPIDVDGLHISIDTNSGGYTNFHRWINGQCNLYKFDSDWVVVNQGTSESKTAFGYILLSADHTQMSVYHLWGE